MSTQRVRHLLLAEDKRVQRAAFWGMGVLAIAGLLAGVLWLTHPSHTPARSGTSSGGALGQVALAGSPTATLTARPQIAPGPWLTHPGPVTVAWGESTGLVRWPAIAGAHGYRVTLIRLSDKAIMERITLPAGQLAADAQGVWPNEEYAVAVQPLDANGTPGAAIYSAPGHATPISRAAYNGFLDAENVAQGQVDPNLWDVTIGGQGGTFVNNQLHYHLEAGNLDGSQAVVSMRARVPLDWSNRTATIHGEVDLKGDATQWFGVTLSPQSISEDRMMDLEDRFYSPRHMPQLELFDRDDGLHLLYAVGDGTPPVDMGSPYPNPVAYNNVRDTIIWKVSVSHVTVLVDGNVAFDTNLPHPLGFTHGYLSLFAESYPGVGGRDGISPCDAPMQDCNVWHLDNWGFDAATGTEPTATVYYDQGCGPTPSREAQVVSYQSCDDTNMDPGIHSFQVRPLNPSAQARQLTSAAVALDVKGLFTQGQIQVRVNGGAWETPAYSGADLSPYDFQSYVVPVDPSLVHTGANTVDVRPVSNPPDGADFEVANVQLETMSSIPYSAPSLPPEPAPLGVWSI